MAVRNFREGDEIACAGIARLAFEQDKKLSKEGFNHLIECHSENMFLEKSRVYDEIQVFEENNKIEGVVCFDKGELKGLYVHQKYQQEGIGTHLMKCIEKIAEGKNCDKINLEANLDAVPFYEKLGYTQKKQAMVKDTDITIAIMGKKI